METLEIIKIILYSSAALFVAFFAYKYYQSIKDNKARQPYKYITIEELPDSPFSDTVEVVLNVPESIRFQLQVIDDQDNICQALFEGELKPGLHKFRWDTTKCDNIFYYLTLKSEHQLTEKRVLVKNA